MGEVIPFQPMQPVQAAPPQGPDRHLVPCLLRMTQARQWLAAQEGRRLPARVVWEPRLQVLDPMGRPLQVPLGLLPEVLCVLRAHQAPPAGPGAYRAGSLKREGLQAPPSAGEFA